MARTCNIVFQTAEVYDPVKDEWESIPPMSTARYAAGAASLGGRIYVVGGIGNLACGECYDPKTKIWTRIPNMIDIKGCVKAVASDGALIVSDCDSNVMEIYNPKIKTWRSIKVNNATEDFEIWDLCTLSKKYLPVNLVNMNNNK